MLQYRAWDKVLEFFHDRESISILLTAAKGALAIPTLQSWRRLDGKWCGKMNAVTGMQYRYSTSWTFIVHRAKNLNLRRINVFFLFFGCGWCHIEKGEKASSISWYIMINYDKMNMQWGANNKQHPNHTYVIINRSRRGLSIDVSCAPDWWHLLHAEACEDEASYYLAFELCTGGTLLEAIEDRYAGEWEDCVHASRTRSCFMSGNLSGIGEKSDTKDY